MKSFGCRQVLGSSLTVLAAVTAASFITSSQGSAAQSVVTADPGIKPNAPLDPSRPLTQELVTSTNGNLRVAAVGSLTLSSPWSLAGF